MEERYNKGQKIKSDKNLAIVRTYQIYKDLVEMRSIADITNQYSKEWGITQQSINQYINKAYEIFDKNMEKEFERLATNQVVRVLNIGARALSDNKLDVALKAADIVNKLGGLYTDKIEANVTSDSTIHVSFAGLSLTPEEKIDDEIQTLEVDLFDGQTTEDDNSEKVC